MNNLQQNIIKRALDNDSYLSQWEFEFVSSLADKPASGELSEKQNSVLNRIWEKLDKAGV